MSKGKPILFLAFAAAPFFGAAAGEEFRKGAAAYGDWRADAPGVARKITVDDVPPPYADTPAASRSHVVPRPSGAALKTPPGFSAELVVSGLEGPRVLRAAPNGDIFVAESEGGKVRALRFAAGGKSLERNEVFLSGLERPYGLAFYPPGPNPRFLYVATQGKVLRYPYSAGDLRPSGGAEVVIPKLPAGGHWTRDIVFSPGGSTLYVATGSKTNVAEGQGKLTREEIAELEKSEGVGASGGPEKGRALVAAFDPTGGERRVFATGLRNCSGLAVHPQSDELWCVVNERDMLGDNLPPDYATHVKPHAFYGWPWYYIGAHEDPRHAGERPDLKDAVTVPDVLIQPHSAPLGMSFYEGAQFPEEYKGDAFVALHGSWNRSTLTGYKIIRLRFKNGAPTGAYEDFATGFVSEDSRVWGRPVDVIAAPDGSLLFSEDGNGTIWRIAYAGGR